ncbi:MAG: HIT domain-containing protein [Candidatus Nealsonbacteria bacterium]|nr:HIT domain-containing protein [Candidatus Nealsonbacteria bacterium]
MADCIFCKIVGGEQKADIVYEGDDFIAFKDINPKAPVHVLIIPKKHIASVNHLQENDQSLAGRLVLAAPRVAEKMGVKEEGYKLVFNVGRGGGQVIDHLHLHLLGGWEREG